MYHLKINNIKQTDIHYNNTCMPFTKTKIGQLLILLLLLVFSQSLFAQKKLEELKLKVQNATDEEKAKILNDIGYYYIDSEIDYDNDSSLKYANLALSISRKTKNYYQEAFALKSIGFAYYYQQNFDTCIVIFNKAINILDENEDLELRKYLYNGIGACYYYKGDFNKTLEFWKKQLDINISQNNRELIAEGYMSIGVVHKNMDEYDQAIYYYQEAYKIQEEDKDSIGMASVLNNIGNIYFQFRANYTIALENYLKALDIYKKIGERENEAHLLNSIGLIYYKQEQLKLSLEYLSQALSIFEENKDRYKDRIAEVQTNLGLLHAKLGNFQIAYDYLNKCYQFYIQIGAKPRIAETLRDLGDVYKAWGKNQDALTSYNRSFEIFTELNMKSDIANLYKKFAESNASLGNYKKAFEYHVLYTHLNDSLFTEKLNEQITEIQTKYETEKKDKEIALLNSDKALQDATVKRQRLAIFFFIGGFFIISIFLILIFRLYRQKKKANVILEQKNEEISRQRDHIFQQNKEITSSIEYAKRIQTALLPPQELIDAIIPESFILFKPRDIVSGDYYWLNQKGNKIISVTADCTGHGVPGAFMSMLGISFLNEIVNVTQPENLRSDQVLNHLRELIISSLRQTGKSGESRDGMDMTICIIDTETLMLDYAGAYNAIYIVRGDELIESKPDKMPIGIHVKELDPFTPYSFQLLKGDIIYSCSDGYADQFGGPDNTKFRRKNFKDLLLKIHTLEMQKQKEVLDQTLFDWMAEFEQVDDILVCGIKIV
jgi:tetratricopeptide (TPR) repeat protein